ncbi:MAG: hypothetical protein CVV13_06250 [Gammaproteobacteria bacterium HGW-Gammaproteobacteria-3]|nr:MAG: hypothetical protein CVV13_06250 [Gammaproteobacteria bacterium HGW-Gammaproteobacteria-3]
MKCWIERLTANAGPALFIALTVLPVACALGYSVLYSIELTGLLAKGLTLKHWQQLLGSSEIWLSLGYSLNIAVATVALAGTFALSLTLSGHRYLTAGYAARWLLLPLTLAPTAAALAVLELWSGAGLISRILHGLDLINTPAQFPSPVRAAPGIGIILAELLLAVPFLSAYFLRVFVQQRIGALLTAAQSLGATPFQALVRVALPQLLQKSAGMLLLYGIFVFGAFEIPLLLGPRNPDMISVLVQRKFAGFDLSRKPEAFVAITLYAVIILTLLAAAVRRSPWRGDAR